MPRSVGRVARVLGLLFVIHYFVVPQLAGARTSVSLLGSLDPLLVIAAIVAEAGSLAAYAQFGRSLIPGAAQPSFFAMLRVQLSTQAMSHVIPGGSATTTPLGYRLLRRAGVSASDASVVLSVEPVASALVLNVMLLSSLLVSIPLRASNGAYFTVAITGTAISLSAIGLVYAVSRGSRLADRAVRAVARWLPFLDPESTSAFVAALIERTRQLTQDRGLMLRAAGWAALQWLTDAASLWLFLAALGYGATPYGVLIPFGLANVASAIPLTPGGLGVYEAIVTAGLVGFGAPRSVAIIGVLAYRLVEFWIPIPVGALAYLSAEAT